MKSILIQLIACMMSLAWTPLASAAPHTDMLIADQPETPVAHPSTKLAPIPAAKQRRRRAPRARLRKEIHRKKTLLTHAAHVASNERKPDRGLATAIRNADARDAAERDARAERLYRSSQLSAPIIPDAKACRRSGAHGESIYENC